MLDLCAPDIVTQTAGLLPQPEHATIIEAQIFVARFGVDLRYQETILVAGPLVRQGVEICATFDRDRFLLRSLRSLHVDAHFRLDASGIVNLLHTHEGIVHAAVRSGARYNDLLDQFEFEGPYWVESVDQIIGITMGGRVTQGAQGVQRFDRFLRLVGCIHALGLVNDDNRVCGLHELDGLATGELVAFLVDDVALLFFLGAREVLAKGVDVDDQNLKCVVHCKLA